MKIVVGLGNPGARYASTRHNIGSRIVERFGAEHGIALSERKFGSRFGRGRLAAAQHTPLDDVDLEVALLAPQTYMNRSGDAIAEALRGLAVENIEEDLLVVLDDLDLPFGCLRIRPWGGSAGHRGLESVCERIGSGRFPRLRFGIGRPDAGTEAVDWVLQSFSATEEIALERRIPLATEAIGAILLDGVVASMNRYNRDADAGYP